MFWEPGPPGYPGKCKLDLLTYVQVLRTLERIPFAKEQLIAITDDPILRRLAFETTLIVPTVVDDQKVMDKINKNNTLPFYTVFRGKNV